MLRQGKWQREFWGIWGVHGTGTTFITSLSLSRTAQLPHMAVANPQGKGTAGTHGTRAHI